MEVNFLNQNPCISSWPGVFQGFFCVVLSKSMCISAFGPSFSSSTSFVILFIHCFVVFFCYVFWLPYFVQNCFGFSCIQLLVWFCVISSHLLVEFSFVVLECPVLSVLFYPLAICLWSSFSHFSVLPFPFYLYMFQRLSFVFFFILAGFRRFFICVSSRISHPGLDFFFVLFERIQIFSLTNFAPT